MVLTPGQALDPNSAASSGDFNLKKIKSLKNLECENKSLISPIPLLG
jgi:hypothetical protein